MKDLLKIAIVLPLCFNTFLWGQTAKTSEISDFAQLNNAYYYDPNALIINNIIFPNPKVIEPSKTVPYTISGQKLDNGKYPTIDGAQQGYTPWFTPAKEGNGSGFRFANGSNVTIKDLNFTNFTHRERGTIYLNNSKGTLENVTMDGFEQYLTDGHIWGSMVAFVDHSLNNVIKNSTFQNVNLTLDVTQDADFKYDGNEILQQVGEFDSDGGVLHIQGSQSGNGQSTAEITGSNFLSNELHSNRNIYGAAVYNEGILSKVSGSRFEYNSVDATGTLDEILTGTEDYKRFHVGGFGGAFSLGSHYTGRGSATITELKDTNFSYNTVTSNEGFARGGALWSGDGSIIGAITNCTFTGNSSVSTNGKASGGAIYNNGTISKIVNSTFTDNYVQSPNNFVEGAAVVMTNLTGAGGAIFTKNDITIQDGTKFSGNSIKYVKGDKTIEVGNDIHLSTDNSVGAKLTITTSAPQDNDKKVVSVSSGIASKDSSSSITVKGGSTLKLSGVNQFFTGQTNIIENSIIDFTQTAKYKETDEDKYYDSFLNGTVNIGNGSKLNFANGPTLNSEGTSLVIDGTVKNLTGDGIFHKTGSGAVTIGNTDNPDVKFDGLIDLDGGTLSIYADSQDTKGQPDFTAQIGEKTTFNYNNNAVWSQGVKDDHFTLNSDSKFSFDAPNSNSTLNFKGHGTFTITGDITNAERNNITLYSTTTSFATNDYYANYSVDNSTIKQKDGEINNVVFHNGFHANATLDLEFDFTNQGVDKISATNGSGALTLGIVEALNKDKDLGQIAGTPHTYKVLNGLTFDSAQKTLSSDIYEYTVQTVKTTDDQTDLDGLKLFATGLKADTLYLLNHEKSGQNRYFYFLGDEPYNVGKDLRGTLAGNLYVTGKSDKPLDSIITGNEQFSFFQNNQNDITNLYVNNVTLEKAKGKGIASVLDVNENYTASFDNVVIRDNTVENSAGKEAKASAISNNGGTVTLNDVTFTNNTGVNSYNSYIYNSGDMTISTTIDRILNNGASGNKITNDTNGTLDFTADAGTTYTIASAIDNAGKINTSGNIVFTDTINNTGNLNVLTNSIVTLSNNSGITGDNGMIDIANDGKLLLTGNTSDITINSGFKGNGIIEKSDTFTTNINGKNEGFEGQVKVTGGILKYTKTDNNSFFNPKAVITVDNIGNKNATLDYTTDNANVIVNSANINLKNNANFIFSGREAGDSLIRINGKILNSDDTSNSYLFEKGDYALSKEVNFYKKDTGLPDNITFLNAKARFEMDDEPIPNKPYTMGNANWTLDNAEFRFLNKAAGNKYTFNTLTVKNNSKMSLDLDLTLDKTNGKNPIADTFTAGRGDDQNYGGGVVEIVRIGVTADNGEFNEIYNPATDKYTLSKGVIPIFTDKYNKLRVADRNNATILNWGTNAYKFNIKSASSDGNRIADSIEIAPISATHTGTLRELNQYGLANGGGNRGFSFIVKKNPTTGVPESSDYNIYRDLDETSAGTFSVLGTVDAQIGKSTLDGELEKVVTKVWESYDKLVEHKDVDGNVDYITYDGEKIYDKATHPDTGHYTYNEVTHEYTIDTEAFTQPGQDKGSMFEIVNNTNFLMRDLVVKNAARYASDTIKDGPVIYANNKDAEIYLENVDVINNFTESGNGGAIANYLNKSFTIQNMQADSNTAGGLGGAIYTAANMNIIDSDFGKTGVNKDKNGLNDIYIAGEKTRLEYSVSEGETRTINSGLAGDGQFIKTGKGTLKLSGQNEGLEGLFAVDGGNVIYTKDTSADSFATGAVSLTGELEMAIADTLTETIQNVSSVNNSAILTKTGTGTLNLDGNNSGFTGTANINEGAVTYTASAATSYISGVTNIAQPAILNYIANQTSTLNKVAGAGTINYSGTSALTFNGADNTGFEGVINANGTQLNVTGTQTDKFGINIQKGILNYIAPDNANINLGGTTGKITFASGSTGAEAIFNGGNSYILDNIQNVINNTITFKDTTVKAVQNSYTDGNYTLDNTILNLVNNTTGKVSFGNLTTSNDSKLGIDVDLSPLPNAPASDILSVTNGSGTLTLTEINVLNSRDNKDNGLNSKYEFNVVEGPLTINKNSSVSKWATNVYEYDVKVNDTGKSIIMSAVNAANANSLKAMNKYDGTRGFQFREGDTNPYVIGSNLETTAKGTFTVKGTGDTVISGDDKYSFFDVQNPTNLIINNVTITNAKKSDGAGAVINAVNSAAKIELNNVTLRNNFDKNGKNDIYIEQGAKVTANNSSINSGIAGAGTLDANNLTLSGKNSDFRGTINVTKEGLKFTQTDAKDSYISGTTNVGTSSVTLNIDKGNTSTGNFVGAGTLTKEGSKDALITGDNSHFKGNININNGSISYNADVTKYFGGNTILAKDGGLKVTTNNSTDLSKISGAGTISKDGSGTLRMTGDNSGFNGNLNINNGIFALAAGSSIGQIANGVFENATAINLQNTAAIQDNKGNWTTNPAPASIQNLKFNNLTLNGNVGLNLDVDLKNTIADTISANTVSGHGHLILDQNSINVVSDSLLSDTTVRIASGAVAESNRILLSSDARSVMGPIQKYTVDYAGGNLEFSRQGGFTPSVDAVNPSVMSSVVATQIGGYLTQLQTLQDGFYHMNRYTKYPSLMRLGPGSIISDNTTGKATKETPVSYKSRIAETSQSMWVKPYTSFESIHLRGGVDVDAITYGSLYGGDSDLVDIGHGFKGVISTFVGYNGSQQSFNGISMNQNGGTLGLTGTLYKGNFFTGLTASTGASAGEAYTPYGHDNFAMITAGIANKTGYNWEIKEGKLIVQPSLFLGYTFVNTFDYRNSAGIKMDSDALNAIQIVPGIRFIGNLKNGWQPYIGVDMVWNIMDKTNVMANDVRLPQLSVKPYVQYGVGIQKSWGERFTGFFQTMIRNGGRNGVMLSFGFRWALGKKPEPIQSTGPKKKKIIREMENL